MWSEHHFCITQIFLHKICAIHIENRIYVLFSMAIHIYIHNNKFIELLHLNFFLNQNYERIFLN